MSEQTMAKESVVKIDAVKVAVAIPEKAATSAYWVGVLESCPYRPVTVAGLDFPYAVTPPRQTKDGEWYRERLIGKVVSLSDADVEKIKAAVVRKTVRWNSARTRAYILSMDNIAYSPEAKDEPLAKYLYMIRLSKGSEPTGFRRVAGEPMLTEEDNA